MRRRALLAASGASGVELQFPITLVEGDNGDIGKAFYDYVSKNGHNNEEVYIINNGYVIITHNWFTASLLEGVVLISDNWDVIDGTNGVGSPGFQYVELDRNGYLTII